MRLLRDTIEPITTPIFGKKGMYYAQLLTKWAEIVGPEIALHCQPVKLARRTIKKTEQGILSVQVNSSAFSMQLIYQSPLIKEKIAQFFGFNLVDEIRVVAASELKKQSAITAPVKQPSPDIIAAFDASLEGIDAELVRVLSKIGHSIASRR